MESLQGAELLIPGLPFYLAIACLLKVPRVFHVGLRGVSRIWRDVLCSEDFYRWRRLNGFLDPWLVILSTDHMGSPKLGFFAYDLPSRQLLFKAPLPPFTMLPFRASGADDYKLAGMNEYFIVLNWQKDGIWTEEVPFLIYNSLTNSYKKGACLSVRRQAFSCGIINGKLYITAGFNFEGRFEHSTECYDFVKDEWKFMASLPRVEAGFELEHVNAILEVEDDAVFQGQFYLRLRLHSHCRRESICDKLYVVYDPITDAWQEKPCLTTPPSPANDGQLTATDNALFSLTRDNEFYRFDGGDTGWTLVGKIGGGGLLAQNSSTRAQQQVHRDPNASGLSKESKRVFAYGNDLFVLASSSRPGFHSAPLDNDGTKYHRLFLGNSSYRAGAVVLA